MVCCGVLRFHSPCAIDLLVRAFVHKRLGQCCQNVCLQMFLKCCNISVGCFCKHFFEYKRLEKSKSCHFTIRIFCQISRHQIRLSILIQYENYWVILMQNKNLEDLSGGKIFDQIISTFICALCIFMHGEGGSNY